MCSRSVNTGRHLSILCDNVDARPWSAACLIKQVQLESPGGQPAKRWDEKGDNGKEAIAIVAGLNYISYLGAYQILERILPFTKSPDSVNRDQ
jgi:hypothetical protein